MDTTSEKTLCTFSEEEEFFDLLAQFVEQTKPRKESANFIELKSQVDPLTKLTKIVNR